MSKFTDSYLLYMLAHASADASAEFHATLEKQKISVSTWRVLASLYPDSEKSLNQLAKDCIQKQPTMTRIIDRLEKDGIVTRITATKDKRGVKIALTNFGLEIAKKHSEQAKRHEARIFGSFEESEIKLLKKLLTQIQTTKINP